MQTTTVYDKLKTLNLNHVAQILDKSYPLYHKQDLDFFEILNLVLDSEINYRHNKRIQTLIKGAKMRETSATVEDINFTQNRGLKKSSFTPLLDFDWVNKNNGIIFTGASGLGKTWLACSMGNQACRLELKTMFINANQLYEELNIAMLDKNLTRVKQKYIKNRLLIIDDFGLGGVDSTVTPALLEIIDKQSSNGGLIITSQFPTSVWHSFFEDSTLADAILDRIIHRSYVFDLKGESMRKLKATR